MRETSASSWGTKPCDLLAPFLLTAILGLARGLREEPPDLGLRVAPVDVTEASGRGLQVLSGAGASLERRIRAYRELVDPLLGADDLRRVPGVGSQRLHQWAPWLMSGAVR